MLKTWLLKQKKTITTDPIQRLFAGFQASQFLSLYWIYMVLLSITWCIVLAQMLLPILYLVIQTNKKEIKIQISCWIDEATGKCNKNWLRYVSEVININQGWGTGAAWKKTGAGAAWKKSQEPEPELLKNYPAPQPC